MKTIKNVNYVLALFGLLTTAQTASAQACRIYFDRDAIQESLSRKAVDHLNLEKTDVLVSAQAVSYNTKTLKHDGFCPLEIQFSSDVQITFSRLDSECTAQVKVTKTQYLDSDPREEFEYEVLSAVDCKAI